MRIRVECLRVPRLGNDCVRWLLPYVIADCVWHSDISIDGCLVLFGYHSSLILRLEISHPVLAEALLIH